MTRSPRPFLVDMDGTLVDSTVAVENAWRGFCELHGLDLAEVLAFAHGRPTLATTSHFLDCVELAEREALRIQAGELEVREGVGMVPGAADFVAALGDDWALVTSADRALATRRMQLAGVPMPSTCVFSEDITRGKPDPQPYQLAAERLGVDIAECIVLEDSPAGIRAGLASGATTVVVGTLSDFDDRLLRLPDLTGTTPEQLSREV